MLSRFKIIDLNAVYDGNLEAISDYLCGSVMWLSSMFKGNYDVCLDILYCQTRSFKCSVFIVSTLKTL